MSYDFEYCVERVLLAEGGYSNDSHDSGGPTKYGITQADLSVFRGHPVTASDVRDMALSDAKLIYKKWYWDEMNLDLVTKDQRCLLLFDQGVNRGCATAIKQAQMLLASHGIEVKLDGKNGTITSSLINSLDYNLFCRKYLQMSQTAYVKICLNNKTQLVFLRGWLNRVNALWDICWP